MHYDPIKNVFASVIRKIPFLRVVFYKILDLMFLRSWYVRRELKQLRKNFRDKKIKILDAGTGYGQYAYFMAKHLSPCEIKAVDIKEDWIFDCKEFFNQRKISNVRFEIEDLTKLNYTDEFDLIVCVDVMEHIPDDVKVFENFYTALNENGYLLINTPSIFGGSDVHDEDEESFIGEHARVGYSKEELESKLHLLGFSTYKSQYTYGFWGDKAWRLGIKYPMILLNLSKIFFIALPVYYLITFPFTFLMMYLDFISRNNIGSGINFIAKK
ncbi:Methyltransferase type 11 [Ignavibacterium album JCM 16511]|uniref:Methyltransferase type 11 n=1 Tax=Ignavibacterium album (strain DSM 19864 / JCM 16511 / NBRC 101810 / Mat9-16) TaxID=945713 RepID=I0ANN6_IGNAJ|nr:class I SAM-dependent methyltransferase [Ignavibacterium album]AFH50593.1 Methyltransferase type 11 [Ignavibacterium album JCM 16511]